MKITFKSQNGCCPQWEHEGIRYYLYEDYDGSWTLMSKRIGFKIKNRFCKGKYGQRISPYTLLDRFFRNKNNVREKSSFHYKFYYWKGIQFATDGKDITIQYESSYERPSFDNYLDCLADAKAYLEEKYEIKQMSLFDYNVGG